MRTFKQYYLSVFIAVCFSITVSVSAQETSELSSLAEKAESFYPAKLDSSLILAEYVLNKIRETNEVTPLEEKMLDLKGWASRRKGDIQQSEQYFLESIALSEKKNNLEQLGSTYNRLGLLYRGTGRFNEAFESYTKSLEYRNKLNDERGIAATLNNLGNLYRAMGETEKAYDTYVKSIEMREKLGDKSFLASGYLNLGNWMAGESDFEEASAYYLKYKEIQEELADTAGLARVATNLGNIYNDQGDYAKALRYYLESIALSQLAGLNNETSRANNFLNLGLIYSRTGYPNDAIQNYKSALQIYTRFQDPHGKGLAFQNIGKVFEDVQNSDSALYYYDLAIREFEPLNNLSLLANIYMNIGVIHNQDASPEYALNYLTKAQEILEREGVEQDLDLLYNNIGASHFYLSDFRQAISYFQRSLDLATKTNDLATQKNATSGLSEAYSMIKDYENAYTYQTLYHSYNNSLLNLERVKVIEELITKYETEKVETENKVLLAEKAKNEATIKQRNAENRALLIGLLALMGFVVGIVAWVSYSNRKKRVIAEQKEALYQNKIDSLLDRQQLESISAMLEGQEKERKRLAAELHDRLGSILSLVKMYFSSLNDDIKEKQPELHASFTEGNQFLDDAFKEVRALIKEMQDGTASGEGLDKDLKELLDKITKLGIEINYRIELNKKLDSIVEMNVYRVIQEALSNSLKYSRAELIELVLDDKEHLSVIIKDNGIGFNPQKVPQKKEGELSYGVANMENRVKLLGGKFDLTTKEGQGVIIDINIPLVDKEGVWSTQDLN